MSFNPSATYNLGKTTANAGTAYTQFVPPFNQGLGMLEFLQASVGVTAHTLTVMRPLSSRSLPNFIQAQSRCSCYLTADAAASQAIININQDPGLYTAYFNSATPPTTANNLIAAADWVAFQYPDGNWGVDLVSSVTSLAVTLTNNLGTGGLKSGAPVWFFGVPANVNPYDGFAHPAFDLAASTIVNFGSEGFPFMSSFRPGEPLLVHVNNATNASIITRSTAVYCNFSTPFSATGLS